jgi:hypothetical protein
VCSESDRGPERAAGQHTGGSCSRLHGKAPLYIQYRDQFNLHNQRYNPFRDQFKQRMSRNHSNGSVVHTVLYRDDVSITYYRVTRSRIIPWTSSTHFTRIMSRSTRISSTFYRDQVSQYPRISSTHSTGSGHAAHGSAVHSFVGIRTRSTQTSSTILKRD